MIIRSVARQGRRALFTPPISQTRRALSTETTTTTQSIDTSSRTPLSSSSPPSSSTPNATSPQHPTGAWGARVRDPSSGSPDTIAQDYITMTKLQRKTNKLGSAIERRYFPADLLRNPPAPKDVTLELLMASQTHLGHRTSLWNPATSRYIHGIRDDIHVISLEQTATHLRRAARVVEEVAYRAGLILVVGTRKGQTDIVVRAAELARGCHVFTKWAAGTITNRDQILAGGKLRVVDELDRERPELAGHVNDRRPIAPDLVIVLNPLENFVLLRECAGATIPTIGIIDTDADPGRVTYAIPANDDSLRSVATIAGVLGRAGELGHKRRLRDAELGIVPWRTPFEVQQYIDRVRGGGPTLEGMALPRLRKFEKRPLLTVKRFF